MNKKFLLPSVFFLTLFFVLSQSQNVFAEDMMTATTMEAPLTTLPVSKTATKAAELKKTAKEKLAEAEDKMKLKIASKESELKDRMASKEATLKERLANFKDKKKATLIEKINETLANINQRRTADMLKHIDKLNTILGLAEDKIAQAQSSGKDVSSVTTDMNAAKNAITNAKTAVDQQSKKTYEIKIASESGAKVDVKTTRDTFEKDMKATHGLVVDARRALMNALMKLAQSMGEGVVNNESK